MNGIFITGTDTGVGKTWTSCALLERLRGAGLRVGAYKPVCSGAEPGIDGRPRWGDQESLLAAVGGAVDPERVCPQRFAAAVAPPLAAEAEGRVVDSTRLRSGVEWWREQVDLLLVEGAGGLLSPLTFTETNLDLAAGLGYPLLIVAANRLGTVNHLLLTISAARRGITVAGAVLCDASGARDDSATTNARLILEFTDLPWFATINHGSRQIITRRLTESGLDWMKLVEE